MYWYTTLMFLSHRGKNKYIKWQSPINQEVSIGEISCRLLLWWAAGVAIILNCMKEYDYLLDTVMNVVEVPIHSKSKNFHTLLFVPPTSGNWNVYNGTAVQNICTPKYNWLSFVKRTWIGAQNGHQHTWCKNLMPLLDERKLVVKFWDVEKSCRYC